MIEGQVEAERCEMQATQVSKCKNEVKREGPWQFKHTSIIPRLYHVVLAITPCLMEGGKGSPPSSLICISTIGE